MTRREIVMHALRHEDCGAVPHEISLTGLAWERCTKYFGTSDLGALFHNHIVAYGGLFEATEIKPGYVQDEFGVVWNRTGADKDIGVIDDILLKNHEDLDTYQFPEPNEALLRQHYQNLVDNAGDAYRCISIGFSMFERAWALRGMENLLMDMLLEPEWVHRLLDKICEYDSKMLDIALEYDIDGIHFGDDWGQQKGLIMGPKLWREFIKPQMAKLYKKVKDHGLFVTQHSCGDIHEVLEDCVEIGLDAYQTVQPEIYDLARLKERFRGRLAFWGGISTQRALSQLGAADIARITEDTINLMAKGGGYICAPTHAVEHDVPPENIAAMLEVFRKYDPDMQ